MNKKVKKQKKDKKQSAVRVAMENLRPEDRIDYVEYLFGDR